MGAGMTEQKAPRTRLEQVLRQRHLTLEQFRKDYNRTADVDVSDRQAYRWVAGEVRGLPYPQAQATLEKMFGEPVERLFGPRTAPGRSGDPTTDRHRGGATRGRTGKGR
jgi:hypothetical protein